jgi:hypothetical protein
MRLWEMKNSQGARRPRGHWRDARDGKNGTKASEQDRERVPVAVSMGIVGESPSPK